MVLNQPDRQRAEGVRDYILLSFLFHTGARVQEALDVRPQDIRFEAPPCVPLFGQGRKERLCPLWPETAAAIKGLLRRQPRAETEPSFVNRYGRPLAASGVRFKLAELRGSRGKGLSVPGEGADHSPHLSSCRRRPVGKLG